MNNSMEMQREAIIEIVGTQYEGRAENHNSLFLQQGLVLKHQSDNPHDHNAVLLLTEDGKELGFLPKGYASLYAPAIDSGRYTFSIEIVKAENDPERPILIIKIISELASHSEEDIESAILTFVQNIVNGYAQGTKDYLTFIYSDKVDVENLLSALDRVRLIQKLISCANDIIEDRAIKPNSDKITFFTKESSTQYLGEIRADVSDVLKKIQKAYNESLDIDDEEEYHHVQSEIRERRKRFRQYDELLASLLDKVTAFSNIITQPYSSAPEVHNTDIENTTPIDETALTISEPEKAEPVPVVTNEPINNIPDTSQLTEQDFFDWLVSEGGASESTAKQYISNIHSIEKLYQTLFGIRRNILGAPSADNVRSMIESLIQRSEYIDANERRHNSFGTSLSKFARFADIVVGGLNNTAEKNNYQPSVNTQSYVIKTMDFENPHNCAYYKPCSFILNELRYSVGSWRELYTKFLILLYTDNTYSEIVKELNGKSLYGHRIDFADKTLSHELRRPIRVSFNFFAEGNLSAIDTIKHIKCLMELCSIDDEHMIIEYSTQEKDNDTVLLDNDDNNETKGFQQLSIDSEPEQNVTGSEIKETINTDSSFEKTFTTDEERIAKDRFIEWLTNVFGLAPATAQSYYSSIITSERIAREQNLKSQRLLSAQSYTEARETFNELLKCDAFVKMNATAHNSLTAGIRKLMSYILAMSATSAQEITPSLETTEHEQPSIIENTVSASFTPDTTKPFALKDAVIEILLTDAPEITKYHEHKGGISSKNLRELINAYYGKTIGLFEISKLLMLDKTFQSVGKGCYIVNEVAIPHSELEPKINENNEPVEIVAEPVSNTDLLIAHEVTTIAEPVKPMIELMPTDTQTVIHEETTADDTIDTANENKLTIEPIITAMKENYDNLQYENGFGAYEVKTLLSQKGYNDLEEDEIGALMSDCSQLREIEDGYYTLAEAEDTTETTVEVSDSVNNRTEDTVAEVAESPITSYALDKPQQVDTDARRIVLRLNGNVIRAYDYSDALNKVCEFSINCKPFKMARIAGQAIQIHGNSVFYRKSVPVDGYNRLSNGLQIITITTLSDLQTITAAVQKYCQIDDDMIAIISK